MDGGFNLGGFEAKKLALLAKWRWRYIEVVVFIKPPIHPKA